MKKLFNRLSIRYKLTVLMGGGSVAALLLSGTLLFSLTWMAERDESIRTLHQLAGMAAENLRAALAFNDGESASNMLAALRSHPHILLALVEAENGTLLGSYRHPGVSPEHFDQLHQRMHARHQAADAAGWPEGADVQDMTQDYHYVVHPVELDGEHLGIIAIVADNQAMLDKMQHFLLIMLTASLLLLMFLFLVSLRLQRVFTRPVLDLVRSMRRIGKDKDYATRLDNPYQDEFGELYQGFNRMLHDIYERDERLSQQASTDTLTGLANRRFAAERFAVKSKRSLRNQEPLGIILLDIDHFKQVNDSWGHAAGDRVLQDIARILQSGARPYDLPVRLGGEEFMLLCDNAGPDVVQTVAERIRQAVEAHEFVLDDGRSIRITSSLGCCSQVADADADAALMQTMIDRADKALYCAKRGGRNRVELAPA